MRNKPGRAPDTLAVPFFLIFPKFFWQLRSRIRITLFNTARAAS